MISSPGEAEIQSSPESLVPDEAWKEVVKIVPALSTESGELDKKALHEVINAAAKRAYPNDAHFHSVIAPAGDRITGLGADWGNRPFGNPQHIEVIKWVAEMVEKGHIAIPEPESMGDVDKTDIDVNDPEYKKIHRSAIADSVINIAKRIPFRNE